MQKIGIGQYFLWDTKYNFTNNENNNSAFNSNFNQTNQNENNITVQTNYWFSDNVL